MKARKLRAFCFFGRSIIHCIVQVVAVGNGDVYTLYIHFKGFAMSKEAVFTMKLEPELRADFMAAAEAAHRPASQVLRELMREFIKHQRQEQEYDAFLERKVEAGRASMRSGVGHSNEEVDAMFAARRAAAAGKE